MTTYLTDIGLVQCLSHNIISASPVHLFFYVGMVKEISGPIIIVFFFSSISGFRLTKSQGVKNLIFFFGLRFGLLFNTFLFNCMHPFTFDEFKVHVDNTN